MYILLLQCISNDCIPVSISVGLPTTVSISVRLPTTGLIL